MTNKFSSVRLGGVSLSPIFTPSMGWAFCFMGSRNRRKQERKQQAISASLTKLEIRCDGGCENGTGRKYGSYVIERTRDHWVIARATRFYLGGGSDSNESEAGALLTALIRLNGWFSECRYNKKFFRICIKTDSEAVIHRIISGRKSGTIFQGIINQCLCLLDGFGALELQWRPSKMNKEEFAH